MEGPGGGRPPGNPPEILKFLNQGVVVCFKTACEKTVMIMQVCIILTPGGVLGGSGGAAPPREKLFFNPTPDYPDSYVFLIFFQENQGPLSNIEFFPQALLGGFSFCAGEHE